MSYEGYTQTICEVGHYSESYSWVLSTKDVCWCGKGIAWVNSVDDTNCEAVGHVVMDGFMVSDTVYEECPHCGHVEAVGPAIYRIPTLKEECDAATYFDQDTLTRKPLNTHT